jgi:hypothetical protein
MKGKNATKTTENYLQIASNILNKSKIDGLQNFLLPKRDCSIGQN